MLIANYRDGDAILSPDLVGVEGEGNVEHLRIVVIVVVLLSYVDVVLSLLLFC